MGGVGARSAAQRCNEKILSLQLNVRLKSDIEAASPNACPTSPIRELSRPARHGLIA